MLSQTLNFKARPNASKLASRLQRGVTLLQVSIVIGIGLVLLLAAVIYGPPLFGKGKVGNEITAVGDLKSNVVNYGTRVGVFNTANSTLSAIVGQGFFPTSMVGGTAAAPTVTNQWGGAITMAIGTIANAGDSMVFTYGGIPGAACAQLGTSLDPLASIISINGTQTKGNGADSVVATVNAQCASGGDNNSLVLTLAK